TYGHAGSHAFCGREESVFHERLPRLDGHWRIRPSHAGVAGGDQGHGCPRALQGPPTQRRAEAKSGSGFVCEASASRILLAKVRQERERLYQTRYCARDGGWPSEAGLQEQASNNHKLRWSKARVVSVMEKARLDRVMCRSRRRTRGNR